MYSKFKIYYQTQQNIHDILLNKKRLTKRKWKKFLTSQKIKAKQNKPKVFLKPIRVKTLYNERLKSYRKFNYFYGGLKKKQLKKNYNLLKNKKNIIDNLIVNLEKRLDIVLYKTSIFKSLFEIQQLISHNKIKINWSLVKSKNYMLEVGDYIWICPEIQQFEVIMLPSYLEWNNSLNLLCLFKQPKIVNLYYSFNFNKTFILDFLK
jgi:ribosomal protein S4